MAASSGVKYDERTLLDGQILKRALRTCLSAEFGFGIGMET